jgi:hypothetical protein
MTTPADAPDDTIVLQATETLSDGRTVHLEIDLNPGPGQAPATWPRSPEDLSKELRRIACDLVQPLTGEVLADQPDALEQEFVERYRRAAEVLLRDAGQSLDGIEVDIDPGAKDPIVATNRRRLAEGEEAAETMNALLRVHVQYSLDLGAT